MPRGQREGRDGDEGAHAAMLRRDEARYTEARMAENHSARSGLLVRVHRCRCAEGTVLKRDMQGRTSGWRTRALYLGVSCVVLYVLVGLNFYFRSMRAFLNPPRYSVHGWRKSRLPLLFNSSLRVVAFPG